LLEEPDQGARRRRGQRGIGLRPITQKKHPGENAALRTARLWRFQGLRQNAHRRQQEQSQRRTAHEAKVAANQGQDGTGANGTRSDASSGHCQKPSPRRVGCHARELSHLQTLLEVRQARARPRQPVAGKSGGNNRKQGNSGSQETLRRPVQGRRDQARTGFG